MIPRSKYQTKEATPFGQQICIFEVCPYRQNLECTALLQSKKIVLSDIDFQPILTRFFRISTLFQGTIPKTARMKVQ